MVMSIINSKKLFDKFSPNKISKPYFIGEKIWAGGEKHEEIDYEREGGLEGGGRPL